MRSTSTSSVLGLIGLLGLSLISPTSAYAPPKATPFDDNKFSASDIIHKDVLIIGGGSTGTYAAIKLLDANRTAIVVEKDALTGGHTQTYLDPVTGAHVDYGVVVFHNNDFVKKYFARFNIPLVLVNMATANTTEVARQVDFNTGKIVTNFVAQDPIPSATGYFMQLLQYPYVEKGFDLVYPVPSDLLLPLKDFLKKYSLEGMSQLVVSFAQGLGNVLDQPTLYVFKNFGTEIILNLQGGFLTTARNNNGELYTVSATELLARKSLLLSSEVISIDRRSSSGVRAIVKTPTGLKLIIAKQVLLTTPPKPELLKFFDLNKNELKLFSQFTNSAYCTGVLRNSGVPDRTSLTNADPNTEFFVPRFPGVYNFYPTGVPGLLNVKWGSPTVISDDAVKAAITGTLDKLVANGVISQGKPEFVAFSCHNPFQCEVSADAIRKGFYKRLGDLQGKRATWYTGAAFHTHDSSLLWEFTEEVVNRIIKVL